MTLEVITRAPARDAPAKETPLLLIHGLWHGAWAWEDHFLPYFAAQGYHVHALSLSGHGNSPGNVRWMRSSRLINDVESVIAGLPRSPILIGHSMGGYIVQKVLERQVRLEQPRSPAAVLFAPVPPFGALPATLRFFSRHPLAFLKCNYTLQMRPIVETPALAREILFSPATPENIVLETFAKLQTDSYFLFLDMLLLNLPRTRHIDTPMLVLGAEKDGIFTPSEIEATARRYHAPVHIFPSVGHNLMRETAWQAPADHILAWLGSQGL